MVPGWWTAIFKDEKPYTEPYTATSPIDPDSDGDGLLDVLDDVDHDGWANAAELSRDHYRVQPFSSCLPDYNSATCAKHRPIENKYPPFDTAGPLPPAPIQTVP